MNAAGIGVLVTAYLMQQMQGLPRQIRGRVAVDGQGGFCTLALLLHSVKCPHLGLPDAAFQHPDTFQQHKRCQRRVAKRYEIDASEWMRLREENDTLDWLAIAALHQPEEVQGP